MIRRTLAAVTGVALALSVAATGTAGADELATPGTAGATTLTDTPEPARPAFYEPPAQLPSTPGTIIRQEPATYFLDPLDVSSALYTSTRVMYASKDREGKSIAVTGIVITPKTAWLGVGRRPLISYAAGTQGMADRCAPTRYLSEGFEYEASFISGLLSRGFAVALTDYQGLGTPGSHTYMNRQVQGQAVLDMARAAQRLPGTGLSTVNPVGVVGYSQGGGAAASAAELGGSYAPELDIKGVVAGAVPADLGKVGENLDGGTFAAFGLYAMVGLGAGYHIDVDPLLNEKGQDTIARIEGSCVLDLFSFSGVRSSTLSANGQSITDMMKVEPFKSVLADNKIGNRRPQAPVLLTHSALDDTIPFSVGKQLARDWCEQDANVRWSPNVAPTHLGGAIPNIAEAGPWLSARFAGIPQASNCWTVS